MLLEQQSKTKQKMIMDFMWLNDIDACLGMYQSCVNEQEKKDNSILEYTSTILKLLLKIWW
jgi:hypothetical protein